MSIGSLKHFKHENTNKKKIKKYTFNNRLKVNEMSISKTNKFEMIIVSKKWRFVQYFLKYNKTIDFGDFQTILNLRLCFSKYLFFITFKTFFVLFSSELIFCSSVLFPCDPIKPTKISK